MFFFSAQNLSEPFMFPSRIERDVDINVLGPSGNISFIFIGLVGVNLQLILNM